ncbi:NFKB1 factor, partial [Polypterus senegalus]
MLFLTPEARRSSCDELPGHSAQASPLASRQRLPVAPKVSSRAVLNNYIVHEALLEFGACTCSRESSFWRPGGLGPYVKITEQPRQIFNYEGPAKIIVQCVTTDEPPLLHADSVVGKQCENGVCVGYVNPDNMTASFPNLGILHVPRRIAVDVLEEQLIQGWMKENCGLLENKELTREDRESIRKAAEQRAKKMDLSVVRLMFTAYLPDENGHFTRMLEPVVSGPIYDSKAPNASNLNILRMDKTSGSVAGGEEVFLLCDKVQKAHLCVAVPVAVAAIGGYLYYHYVCRKRCKKSRINQEIDKDNPKVFHSFDIEDIGTKKVYCRCWRSKKLLPLGVAIADHLFPYGAADRKENYRYTASSIRRLSNASYLNCFSHGKRFKTFPVRTSWFRNSFIPRALTSFYQSINCSL